MSPASRPRVAVVGAGIVGSLTAYELARAGCEVDVYDADPLSAETSASFGNAGVLALSYALPMSNPRNLWAGVRSLAGGGHDVEVARPVGARTARWMLRFALESRPFRAASAAQAIHAAAQRSVELYDDLASREGLDLGFRRTGWLYVGASASAVRLQEKLAAQLASVGVRARSVPAAELRELEPGLNSDLAGGVLYPGDVSMDPRRLTQAVREAARAQGVRFHHARVTGADRHGGRVRTLRTETGATVQADQFLVAAGAASASLGGMLGVRIPVTRGSGWSLTLPSARPLTSRSVMGIENHVVINDCNGSVRISGGMRFGGPAHQPPPLAQLARLRTAAEAIVPGIAEIPEEGEAWIGARPMTPSGLPFVRRVDPGAVVVTGHGTLGMTLAPQSAEEACRLVVGPDGTRRR